MALPVFPLAVYFSGRSSSTDILPARCKFRESAARKERIEMSSAINRVSIKLQIRKRVICFLGYISKGYRLVDVQ